MFKTNPVSLKELLDNVDSGKIQLPDFQRGWVWDDDRIRGLLASISRGFPVGAIMTLEAGGEILTRVFLGRESVEASGSVGPSRVWLGQGRLEATVTGSVRAERPRVGGSAGVAGRAVRRTEAAGVWRERWRSAMRVPRRRRG